jgi:hypothetical protein
MTIMIAHRGRFLGQISAVVADEFGHAPETTATVPCITVDERRVGGAGPKISGGRGRRRPTATELTSKSEVAIIATHV